VASAGLSVKLPLDPRYEGVFFLSNNYDSVFYTPQTS
jgi:hypothetical protein